MNKDTGPSVRIFNLAKGLAAVGNDVKIILPSHTTTHQFIDGFSVFRVKGFYPKAFLNVMTKLVNVGRPTSLYFYDLFFVHRASQLIRDADVVQFEQQSSSGIFMPFIKKVLRRRVVVDCHDVFQALRVQHTSTLRKMLETFLEKLAYRYADLALAVSEQEKKLLTLSVPKVRSVAVLPNGVDTTAFSESSKSHRIRAQYDLGNSRIVVFVGNLSYPPNIEAVKILSSIIAPLVHDRLRDSRFLIVGKVHQKIESSEVLFTGFVDNVAEILASSDVAVAPLTHGSGTRLKILEYFSCGLPVVSTSIGAEGLDVENGVDILIEDNLERFALRIVELLTNPILSKALGRAGRKLAKETYDWQVITKRLDTVLTDLISG
ncbi:MAG TPA: glycosyltransferase family 4 protein [Candidatus Binatia bacterium]|nr:glycosyltransferase family 4 protein [Candidatus Binatia bacterium]